jgi:hypothetical protein
MLALMPLALAAVVTAYLLQFFYPDEADSGTKMVVLGFNTTIILWAKVVYNLWTREESYFLQVWNLQREGGHDQHLVRPSFRGEYKPTREDSNKFEKHMSGTMLGLLHAFSLFVTAFFCIVVLLFIYIWYSINGGVLSFFSGTILVIQVRTMGLIWQYLAPALIEFENHKYQFSYYDSYIWKTFVFQSINSYAAYFYIAVKLQHSENGCPDGSCLALLQRMLVTIQLSLSVVSILEVLAHSYWVKFKLWYEMHQYRKANNGKEPPQRPRSEEEAKMRRFRVEDQINFLCPLVVSAGYIILFGGIVPIMVPLSLLLFAAKLRLGAHGLVKYTQRPFPRRQMGIGAWNSIMLHLMGSGILFSGLLLVTYSNSFVGAPLVTKLSGFVFYCMFMIMASGVVDIFVPPKTEDVTTLRLQHQHVVDKIHEKCQEKQAEQDEDFQQALKKNKEVFWKSPIASAEFSEIKPVALHSAGGSST